MNSSQDELKEVLQAVAHYFAQLAEPTRLRMLHAMCQQELSVSEIVARTGISQTNASRHLKMLHQSGLLARRKSGNAVYYSIADAIFVDLCRAVCLHVAATMDAPLLRKGLEGFLEETEGLTDQVPALAKRIKRVKASHTSSRPGTTGR